MSRKITGVLYRGREHFALEQQAEHARLCAELVELEAFVVFIGKLRQQAREERKTLTRAIDAMYPKDEPGSREAFVIALKHGHAEAMKRFAEGGDYRSAVFERMLSRRR